MKKFFHFIFETSSLQALNDGYRSMTPRSEPSSALPAFIHLISAGGSRYNQGGFIELSCENPRRFSGERNAEETGGAEVSKHHVSHCSDISLGWKSKC